MIDQDQLITLLNKESNVSGSALGASLGVSRMAVQKRIQGLIENGLPINAVPGKGYALEAGVSLLTREALQHTLQMSRIKSLDVFQTLASTNSYLLSQSVPHAQARVCVAEAQTAGRGRRGNVWLSAPYRNVMLSVSWGFDHWPDTITALGLAVALVVTEQLNREFAIDATIKWPNDILVGERKLAGILIDVAGESSGSCNVVIGVGLNVHQPDWSDDSDYQWQDLHRLGVHCDRNQLIAQLVNELTSMLSDFESNGFTPLVKRWNALSSYSGRRIRVGSGELSLEGKMRGVDKRGALLLLKDDGETVSVSDSSVSVRPIL